MAVATSPVPVYLDNTPIFANLSNFIEIPFGSITKSFAKPYSTNITYIDGYDWTQPYPGVSIPHGDSNNATHAVHLTVALDVPIPGDVIDNSTTALGSLTFSVPDSLQSGGKLKPMDDSWFICRHLFVSTTDTAKKGVESGQGCNFMPDQCLSDIRTKLTSDWGKNDEHFMCASLTFDAIPQSCVDTFGQSRSDMYGTLQTP